MSLRDYSTAKDVCLWLPTVLQKERFYGNGKPKWENAQTAAEATSERGKLVKALRRKPKDPSLKWLITRLKSCKPNYRCYSGACPECTRALQRFFASEIEKTDRTLCCVSIAAHQIARGQLETLNLKAYHARMKRLLARSGVRTAAGGVDFSFNVDRQHQYVDGHWSLHLWIFIPQDCRNVWEPQLRALFKKVSCTARPIQIKDYDGDLRAAAYAIKNQFAMREHYIDQKGPHQNFRACRNTRSQRMRLEQRKELADYMNKSGLCGRLFLLQNEVSQDQKSKPYISGLYGADN